MSAAAIIAIAIAVVVVARPPSCFVTLARRRDVRGAGALSRETRRRDAVGARARPTEDVVESRADGAARSRRAGDARAATATARGHRSSETGLAPWVAARSRGARRQPPAVLQPRHRHADERRPRRVRRRRCSSPSCGRRPRGGFGSRSSRSASSTTSSTRSATATASSTPRGPHVDHRVPGRRPAEGRARSTPSRSSPAWRQGLVALYQKCPHLGCRVPSARRASGSSARATARSTTRSARRRAARRRAAWTASRSRSAAAATSPSTPASCHPGPPIGTNTTGQEAEGPHCITGGGALMTTAASLAPCRPTPDRAGIVLAIVWIVGWIVYVARSTSAVGAPRSARRSSWPPTASRTTTTRRSRAGASTASSSIGVLLLVVIVDRPAAVLGARARAARPAPSRARRSRSSAGASAVRTDRRRRLQLRRLPRRHEGHGGVAPYTVTDPVDRRGALGQLEGAGAEHRAATASRRGGPLHPHLRPAGHADAGVGPRGRRPDERPADRRRSSPTSSRSRSHARTACPRRRATRCCETGHLPAEIQADIERRGPPDGRGRHVRQLRRGAVQPRPRQRRLQLRPLPHHGLELRRPAASRARARSAGTSPAASTTAQFPNAADDDRLHRQRLRERQRLRPQRPGQRPHAGLRAAPHRRADRTAIVEYVRRPVMLRPSRSPLVARSSRSWRDLGSPGRSGGTRHRCIRHHRRRAVLCGRLPDPRHQPRRPPRLPRRARRPLRLADPHGHHLGGSTASASRAPSRRGTPSRDAPCCRTTERARTRPACSTSADRRPRGAPRTPTRPTLVARRSSSPRAGRSLDEVDAAASARPARRPACSSRRRRVRRRRVPGPSTCSRSAASATRRSATLRLLLAFWHDPHYAVVQVAPVEPTRTEPGRRPAAAGRSTRPSQRQYVVHGPRPRRPAPAGVRR